MLAPSGAAVAKGAVDPLEWVREREPRRDWGEIRRFTNEPVPILIGDRLHVLDSTAARDKCRADRSRNQESATETQGVSRWLRPWRRRSRLMSSITSRLSRTTSESWSSRPEIWRWTPTRLLPVSASRAVSSDEI